jgi:WD40 repeat protein
MFRLIPWPLLLCFLLQTGCAGTKQVANQQAAFPNFTAWTAGWSHDDRYAAVGNDKGYLTIYETGSWKKIKQWQFPNTTITRVEWNPLYPVLAVASFTPGNITTEVVQLYDLADDKILRLRADSVMGRALTWSPDGRTVAFVGSRGRISLFGKDGSFQKSLSYSNQRSLMEIDWHPTRNLILAVEEDIYLVDVDRDSLLATWDDGSQNKGILTAQWHPSGNFFVTGDYGHENEGGEPSYLRFFDSRGTLMQQSRESRYEYRNVRWSRDGKNLAASGDVLLIFNEKGMLVSKTRFGPDNLWGVGWNSKGDLIISSDQAGNIRITDIKGKIIRSLR